MFAMITPNIKNKKDLGMMQLRCCPSILVLSTGLACGSAWAADYPSEQDFLQDFPVVLSASRLAQPISETPNAMTVIDRAMIDASGARNLPDLFRLVPGMYVGYESGHTAIVAYRGTTDAYARRMQVLIDGRTVYLPPFGQVDWADLPLDIGDIERIEVIRGPSAASHGSNSVQGVISILTYHAAAPFRRQVSINRGDGGIQDVSARMSGAGENWDYRMTLASRSDKGFDETGANPDDRSDTQLFNARASYRLSGHDTLDLQFGYSDTSRRNGVPVPPPAASNIVKKERDQKVISDFQQITWLHTFDQDSDLQLNYYHIRRDTKDDRYTVAPAAGFLVADDALIHRHELELQHTLNISAANRLVWGVGMRDDSVDSPNTFLSPLDWREYRLFAHDEWRFAPSTLLNIGAMAEKNAQGKGRLSPRVALNHHLSPRHTLRASMSVAYRNPEMIEEAGNRRFAITPPNIWSDILAAGGLSPERTLSREIGYIAKLDNAGSTLDLRAYHDQISDIIWVDPISIPNSVVTGRSFKPLFTATHSGLEGTLDYKLGPRSRLVLNYAHQIVSAVPAGLTTTVSLSTLMGYVHNYSQTVPLNSASLLLSHEFAGGLKLSSLFQHQDPVKVLDAGNKQPLMRRLDLRIAQAFKTETSGMEGEIALVIQNAFSDHYKEYNNDVINRRRAWLSATLRF